MPMDEGKGFAIGCNAIYALTDKVLLSSSVRLSPEELMRNLEAMPSVRLPEARTSATIREESIAIKEGELSLAGVPLGLPSEAPPPTVAAEEITEDEDYPFFLED